MILSPINTIELPVNNAVIVADEKGLSMEVHGQRLPLSPRAIKDVASLTGTTQSNLKRLAVSGGADIAYHTRGQGIATLSYSMMDERVVSVLKKPPVPMDGQEVVRYLERDGFSIPEGRVSEGYLTAKKLTAKDFKVGNDTYHAGISADIDLVGHHLPIVDLYVERQVCENGQTIRLLQNERLVPQYADNGAVNAVALSRHMSAWSDQEVPERILTRLSVAAETPASYAEAESLQNLIRSPDLIVMRRSQDPSQRRITTHADDAFDEIFGDYRTRYGVASLKEIPKRELQFLATNTSVAGLVNLSTEIWTHYDLHRAGSEKLNNWWNQLIGRKYNLEGVDKNNVPLPDRWLPHFRHHLASVN